MPHAHLPLERQLKQDMKAADKGRAAGPVPSKAALSRRGSFVAKEAGTSGAGTTSKTAQPTTATAAAIAAAAAATSAATAARGQAPAALGTPTRAKAEAAAATGKPHPAAAGAVPAVASPQDAAKAAAAKPAAEGGADAFIYEEYGFPSAAEPIPAANPLLIFSVLIAYFLFVSACFLIIKYAYHGYDVNAPDVHTVTSKELLAPIQFDPKDLEEGAPPAEPSVRSASGRRAGRKAKRPPARSKRGRRRSTHSPWEEERVTLMAEVDDVPEVFANSAEAGGAQGGVNGTHETSNDDSPAAEKLE
ncbi:uncharacterized protein LOC144135550 isoform X1 [Amblyomma americanum]